MPGAAWLAGAMPIPIQNVPHQQPTTAAGCATEARRADAEVRAADQTG
jgi:hypothetical protein